MEAFALPIVRCARLQAQPSPPCLRIGSLDTLGPLRRTPDQRLPRSIQHQLERRFALGRQLRVATRVNASAFKYVGFSCRSEAVEAPPERMNETKWEREIREQGEEFYAKAKQGYLKDTLACGAVFFALSFTSQYPETVTYSFLCGVGLSVGYVLLLIRSVDRLGKDNFQAWTAARLAFLAAGLILVNAIGLDLMVAFLGFQTQKAAVLLETFRNFVALEFDKPKKR